MGNRDVIAVESVGSSQARQRTNFPLLIFMFVVLPWLTLWYHYLMIVLFRNKRTKTRVLYELMLVATVISLFLLLGLGWISPSKFFLYDMMDNSTFNLTYYLIWGHTVLNLGAIALTPLRAVYVLYDAKQQIFDTDRAYLKKLPGSWAYNWEWSRSPLDKLRRKKNIKKIKENKAWKQGYTAFGINDEGEARDEIVYRSHDDANMQTVVAGSSGSGKTFTILQNVKNSLENGFATVYIDFKASTEASTELAIMAHELGVPFYHFGEFDEDKYNIPYSSGPCTYDPLANAGKSVPDMLVNMRKYDTGADVHRSNAKQFALLVGKMLSVADPKYFIEDGEEIIPTNSGEFAKWHAAVTNLDELAYAFTETLKERNAFDGKAELIIRDAESAMHGKGTKMKAGMETIAASLNEIGNSPIGLFSDLEESSHLRNIDLKKLLSNKDGKGSLVLFSFSADKSKLISESFGSLIMQDLSNIAAARRNESNADNNVTIFVDEYQALPPETLSDMMEKGRSAKMAGTFISQSLAQVAAAGGNSLVDIITSNCSNFIILKGSNRTSAEVFSEILGVEDDIYTVRTGAENPRTLWEKIFVPAERNVEASIRHENKEKDILPVKELQSLKAPNPDTGEPPTGIFINTASAFPDGKNYVKFSAYVSDDLFRYKKMAKEGMRGANAISDGTDRTKSTRDFEVDNDYEVNSVDHVDNDDYGYNDDYGEEYYDYEDYDSDYADYDEEHYNDGYYESDIDDSYFDEEQYVDGDFEDSDYDDDYVDSDNTVDTVDTENAYRPKKPKPREEEDDWASAISNARRSRNKRKEHGDKPVSNNRAPKKNKNKQGGSTPRRNADNARNAGGSVKRSKGGSAPRRRNSPNDINEKKKRMMKRFD